MSNQPVILFDVMDTLVYNPFNQEIPAFFALTQEELLRQKDPTAWVEFEVGKIDEAEYYRRYFDDRRDFDHVQFACVVRDAYRWIKHMKPLLERLSGQGFEIHALSNYPIWYRVIEAKLALSRYLKWTFVSALTGVRKPDPEAYVGAARTLCRPLASCLLIDDSKANCEAADAHGMPAIRFTDATSLWGELLRRDLVVGRP